MFLSKIVVSGTACRNPYEIHRTLWKLFPFHADAKRDFLFRVERHGQQNTEILLQSFREPVTSSTNNIVVLAKKPYDLNFLLGQRLRFFLLANPVKTINDSEGRLNLKNTVKKCRVPLIREDDWHAWINKKLSGLANISSLLAEKRTPINFRKSSERRVGKIQPVSFEGNLSVLDPRKLKDIIFFGIGPAKSFGCGLMSVGRC